MKKTKSRGNTLGFYRLVQSSLRIPNIRRSIPHKYRGLFQITTFIMIPPIVKAAVHQWRSMPDSAAAETRIPERSCLPESRFLSQGKTYRSNNAGKSWCTTLLFYFSISSVSGMCANKKRTQLFQGTLCNLFMPFPCCHDRHGLDFSDDLSP